MVPRRMAFGTSGMRDEGRWAAKGSIGGISSHHLYAHALLHSPRIKVPPTRAMFRDP